MHKAQLFLTLTSFIAIIALYNLHTTNNSNTLYPSLTDMHVEKKFYQWIDMHSKYYEDAELLYRLSIWRNNYRYVQDHNARYEEGLETYTLQMNYFADLTNEQFKHIYLSKTHNNNMHATNECKGPQAPDTNIPETVDWSARGGVTPIKEQGKCVGGWAFSSAAALQGLYFKRQIKLLSFSQQQLIDCSGSYGNHGCVNGTMEGSYYYVIDHGITLQSKYPYKGTNGTCQYHEQDKAFQIRECTNVTPEKQRSLMMAIAQQPVSVSMQANHLSIQLYKQGVYNGNCGSKPDHYVLAVGYGTDEGKKFYKIKNSWGTKWGSQGYIYIIRSGDGKGKCGIQMQSSFPIA